MDAISEARLALLYPPFAAKIRMMATMLEPEGVTFRVTFGLRSTTEQAALFAQGRDSVREVNRLRAACSLFPLVDTQNFKVTNAAPGHSWHQFGLAVDVAPDDPSKPGYQPDWDESHASWGRIVAVGESLGLVSGVSWKDEPHLQMTGRFGKSPNDEVRQIHLDGGMRGVWEEAFK